MKKYYYYLFRIYRFHKDTLKSDSSLSERVLFISTLSISLFLLGIYFWLTYFGLIPRILNVYRVITVYVILGFINHYYFIRQSKFLNFNFKKDIKGGIITTLLTLVILINVIVSGNYNSAKIKKNTPIEQIKKKPSLEGKIRKWFKDNL